MFVQCTNFEKSGKVYLQLHSLGPGPSPVKNIIYRAAVSQKLRITDI
jgi:hypothetical protein